MYERPAARTEGVVTEWVGEDLVIYDAATSTAHALGDVTASVWDLCDGEHSLAEIGDQLALDAELVDRAVSELAGCGLLTDAPVAEPGFSRREAAKRLAQVGGAAFAAPMIYSVAVGPARAAASNTCTIPNGSAVTSAHCTAAHGQFGTSTGIGSNCCASGICYQGRDNGAFVCVASTTACQPTDTICTSNAQCCIGPCHFIPQAGHSACNQ